MRLAIIGAGPGGLYAALAAARQGFAVELFEKRQVGDGIVCGECIFDTLGVMEKPEEGLLHIVEDLILKGKKTYRLHVGSYRNLWMMDRKVWQRGLAEQARAAGVTIRENEGVSKEKLADLKSAYDWVIDASGSPSITSRSLGFAAEYFQQYGMAYQAVVRGDFSGLMPAIKAGFLPDLPKDLMPGYYWVFPRDAGSANIGVGCAARTRGFDIDLKSLLDNVLKIEGLSGAVILKKGGGLLSTRVLSRLVYDNVLLIGDAAGLTSPLHGGGIDLACLSGVLAVQAIAAGQQGIDTYRERLLGYLQKKLTMETLTVEKMRTLNFDAFDQLLKAAAVNSPVVRTRAALRYPDLLFAAWKWVKTDIPLKI